MMMSSGIPMLPNMSAPSGGGNSPNSIILALAAVVLIGAWPEGRQFTSSVQLVEVYASVVDTAGQPIRGLEQSDFEILEDGKPQRIAAFTAGDFPLTAALALDRSFSMAGPPLATVKSAARSFLQALRPDDQAVVIGIGSQVTVLAPSDGSRADQLAAVDGLTAWGTTALHDSIIAAIEAVDGARGRRALVILSAGDDKYSDATPADALARARRSNVMVYPVAIGRTRPPLFAEIATLTGGRSFHARDTKGLDETLRTVAAQLREQYLIGYSPSRSPIAGDNEWRSITVRVRTPGATVRARDGYYVQ
jgi:Ca-activated chloride channel family protein